MKLIICYLIIFLLYGCSGGDFKSTSKSSDNFVIENSSVAYKLATIDNNLKQKTKYSQLLEKMSEHYDKSETFIATQAGKMSKSVKRKWA